MAKFSPQNWHQKAESSTGGTRIIDQIFRFLLFDEIAYNRPYYPVENLFK